MEVFLVRLGKVSRRAVSGLRFELCWGGFEEAGKPKLGSNLDRSFMSY